MNDNELMVFEQGSSEFSCLGADFAPKEWSRNKSDERS